VQHLEPKASSPKLNVRRAVFPKKLWIYWDSGIETAPDLVQICVSSWKKLNPEYELFVLSDATLPDYIDPGAGLTTFDNLTIQKKSNIIRKQLLLKHGGIWVDATVLCLTPLEVWLPEKSPTGFIVLENSSPDRLLCNWFIASEPRNEFIQAWLDATVRYFSFPKTDKPPRHLAFLHEMLMKSTEKGGRALGFWPSWVGARWWPTYPYFISHYLAGKLRLKDNRFVGKPFRDSIFPSRWGSWALRNRIPSYGGGQLEESFFNELETRAIPLMKLNHKPGSPERRFLDPVIGRLRMWILK